MNASGQAGRTNSNMIVKAKYKKKRNVSDEAAHCIYLRQSPKGGL